MPKLELDEYEELFERYGIENIEQLRREIPRANTKLIAKLSNFQKKYTITKYTSKGKKYQALRDKKGHFRKIRRK